MTQKATGHPAACVVKFIPPYPLRASALRLLLFLFQGVFVLLLAVAGGHAALKTGAGRRSQQ